MSRTGLPEILIGETRAFSKNFIKTSSLTLGTGNVMLWLATAIFIIHTLAMMVQKTAKCTCIFMAVDRLLIVLGLSGTKSTTAAGSNTLPQTISSS